MNSKDCERLLRKGVPAWNRWRARHREQEPVLNDADLGGLDLRNADLQGAALLGATLSGATLREADLRGAKLWGVSCRATDFSGTRLSHASIVDSDCEGADFRGSIFDRHGHLSSCRLVSANFAQVDLSGCFLHGSNLAEACLRAASLREADLTEADLRGADCSDATLARADFYKANLSHVRLAGFALASCNFTEATLRATHLQEADLREANFRNAMMEGAFLGGAWLERATLSGAHLNRAFFDGANLTRAHLDGADLSGAVLERANLSEATFKDATLIDANLERAILVRTDLRGARLHGARVYGIAAWDVVLEGGEASGHDLVITPEGEPRVVVDHIDVAQFTYLLLHNPNIRRVIETIGRRGVLILGRFTSERKPLLDAIRGELRRHGFVPILFDFDRPVDRSVRETVLTLAGLSAFIIVDLTNPSSTPMELQAVIPAFEIPVVPIIAAGEKPFAMFADLYSQFRRERGGHLLAVLTYKSIDGLTGGLLEKVIAPAVELSRTLTAKKGQAVEIESID